MHGCSLLLVPDAADTQYETDHTLTGIQHLLATRQQEGHVVSAPAHGSGATIVVLPGKRAVAGHAVRYLTIGMLIPTVIFYAGYRYCGLQAAVWGSLVWSIGIVIHRMVGSQRVEATLVFGLALTVIRGVIGVSTGSAFLYLLQPVISTYATGVILLGSVVIGHSFAQSAVRDFLPLPLSLLRRPRVHRLSVRLTALWGTMYLMNAAGTTWLILNNDVGRFVVVSKLFGLALTALTVLVSVAATWVVLRAERVQIVWCALGASPGRGTTFELSASAAETVSARA